MFGIRRGNLPSTPTRRTTLANPRHGGEGNRTPDLLNAIQALSQLSYAPSSHRHFRCPFMLQTTTVSQLTVGGQEPRSIAKGILGVNERGLAKISEAGILQRLFRTRSGSGLCGFRHSAAHVQTRP